MLYGLPSKVLQFHQVRLAIIGLDIDIHKKYTIETIYSGKNLFSIDIKPEHLKQMEQIIIQSQSKLINGIHSNKKFILDFFNHPVEILMFFLYDNSGKEQDELDRLEIESIGIYLNNYPIWWEKEELIFINFMGIELCILCIDPQYRNITKFKKYINNDINMDTMKSINFSRIYDTQIVIEYNSDKVYNLFITGFNINELRFKSGMGGVAFAS